ncbi:WD domain, g-beta repeat domain-containing protein [Trichoderma breve]|uniref:WD domain, g-beta repeat domain-containing protein n=1 Tax=Trichoderma breve TaxID=2034170 RepID=A0A9W9E4H0_9HYPO|nr:WD domain, g-beta repeat domain-containing protein [Trichoderma breve]KAJ4854376.1 WD domain, g-beta repeat domain-containing protein [Trichoderma breve]
MPPPIPSPVDVGDSQLAPRKDGSTKNPTNGSSGNAESQPLPIAKRSTTLLSRTPTQQLQNGKDKEAKGVSVRTMSSTPPAATALDPLSNQIFLRTNSGTLETSLAQRLRGSTKPDSPTAESFPKKSISIENTARLANGLADFPRDRKKGTSFLSRLAMRSAFKKNDDDAPDSDSELGELRTEGSSARAPMSVMSDGGGYIPLYKEPPRYIRVRSHNSKRRDFNRLFLAQELLGPKPEKDDEPSQGRVPATAVGTRLLKAGDAIWAAEFSIDGRYLAVAGKDQIVRVFAVLSTEEERKAHEEEEEAERDAQGKSRGERLSAPVFRNKPVREFEAHTGEVLALCWSKNNFLLSTSMDKTVRLWHVSRQECLATFTHHDLVTSIAFHPTDDRFFLAGSLDAQLRLWNIPDKSVAFSASTNEFITAVAFSPDGKMAICGVLNGMCSFFETEGLKQKFQIHVRSSRGKNAKGSKITGIKTATVAGTGEVKVLISSNDSRVRIYSLKTRMLDVKFKGLENQSSQIHARFSDDGTYVICGSEDRKAYIWNTNTTEVEMKDRQPYECFDAHPEVVTTALLAPTRTRQLLSASGDPIFDLCNPPPVLLRSLDEAALSQTEVSETGTEIHNPTPSVSIKKPEESPAYLNRCKHMDGNIIVTTDRTGTIKVFRQDCAFAKRQQNMWEIGSKFSSKVSGLGRSGSIITRTSGSLSRRTSLNLSAGQAQHPSDRIMSWRQDVDDQGRASLNVAPIRTERSASPRKTPVPPANISTINPSAVARKPVASGGSPVRPPRNGLASPTGSVRNRASIGTLDGGSQPPTPSFNFISVAESDETDKDGSFWNLARWRGSLSGLRYSVSASSPTEPTHDAAAAAAAATAAADDRKSGDFLKPPNRAAARRSIGVTDLNRPKIVEDQSNRRRSMGPAIRSSKSQESTTVGMAIIDEHKSDQSLPKKRADSGVGRMSDDTAE